MSINSQAEYRTKKEKVLEKFKKEFVEKNYNYDPCFRSVMEMLISGTDPYQIIERLIEDRQEILNNVVKFNEYHAQPLLRLPKVMPLKDDPKF